MNLDSFNEVASVPSSSQSLVSLKDVQVIVEPTLLIEDVTETNGTTVKTVELQNDTINLQSLIKDSKAEVQMPTS